MIRTVFLDLDDTLLDFTKAEAAALARTFRAFGVELCRDVIARYHELNAAQWRLLEEGVLTRAEVKRRRFELLLEELGWDFPVDGICSSYETLLGEGHFFIPGAEEVLRQLAPQYDLYLASNGTLTVQRGRLKSAGIAPFFKGIFISEEVGHNKPAKAFFDVCFSSIPDFDPAAAIIVGDSLTSDIRGGLNAGIRTCWVNRTGEQPRADIVPDYTLSDIRDLPALLERI